MKSTATAAGITRPRRGRRVTPRVTVARNPALISAAWMPPETSLGHVCPAAAGLELVFTAAIS